MTTETYAEELEHGPAGAGRLPWLVAAALLLLLVATGYYAWSAHGRATSAEQAATAATSERDAAVAAAEQTRQLTAQAEAHMQAAEAARQTLEQQLQAANDNVARLEDELEAKAAEAAEAAVSAAPDAAIAVTPAPPVAAEGSAAPAPAPAAGEARPETQAKAASLTITFDVNSSYFPADLGGGLKRLADGMRPGQAYAVELTGAVGAGAQDADTRYNRWLAERRMDRVAEFLQKNAATERLEIKQAFAANDPSRRVVVQVRPLVE